MDNFLAWEGSFRPCQIPPSLDFVSELPLIKACVCRSAPHRLSAIVRRVTRADADVRPTAPKGRLPDLPGGWARAVDVAVHPLQPLEVPRTGARRGALGEGRALHAPGGVRGPRVVFRAAEPQAAAHLAAEHVPAQGGGGAVEPAVVQLDDRRQDA